MQLVLSNNRIIAHGENFLSMGGVVINTETGIKYENATIAECNGGCPSDINEVGYEYHAGVFVPCAPYGKGNNNGYFMEVCDCATPRNSGIPIKNGIKLENIDLDDVTVPLTPVIWENAKPNSNFNAQTITLDMTEYNLFIIEMKTDGTGILDNRTSASIKFETSGSYSRSVTINTNGLTFGSAGKTSGGSTTNDNSYLIPIKIYGVKL